VKERTTWDNARGNLKARIGEGIVESILTEAGNDVRRFGQEWRTTQFLEFCPKIFDPNPLPERFRQKPDFVIKNREGKIEGVEVKFRTNSAFVYMLDKSYLRTLHTNWPRTRIVVVSHDADITIGVLSPPFLNESGDLLEIVPIFAIQEWGVDSTLFSKYDSIIRYLPMYLFT